MSNAFLMTRRAMAVLAMLAAAAYAVPSTVPSTGPGASSGTGQSTIPSTAPSLPTGAAATTATGTASTTRTGAATTGRTTTTGRATTTNPTTADARARDRQRILSDLKAPAGFKMTLFAAPPEVNYPTCLTATPRGEVFIGIDEQGSLGKQEGRGRIVRCVDADNDGAADQVVTFAKLDHPRGLVWDDAARALYVLHPPLLSRYHDDDADGVADRSEVLVRGIGNEKVQTGRGADHTTNGIRMGIDGWIYVAVGDFGVFDATGSDGTRLQLRGGGIVRVRADGSGLETFNTGLRNIYDVAIDPQMNLFTRDNTNDGDGWNDRLAHNIPSGYYGYPSRYKNFKGEFVDCLIDFGGGSPCGSLFVDEPALPAPFGHALYTVEWGQNRVDRHPLTPSGAGFKATTEKLMDLPRGTDIDVDAAGRLYLSSWANGNFNYTGPNVGFILRLEPQSGATTRSAATRSAATATTATVGGTMARAAGATSGANPRAAAAATATATAPAGMATTAPAAPPAPFPDLRRASDDELLKHLASPSGVRRQAAQREILRRGDRPAFAQGLAALAASDAPLSARAAGLFTLKLLRGAAADAALVGLTRRDDLRELALRALADRKGDATVPAEPFIAGTRDANPRVRLVAAWGLARIGSRDAAHAAAGLARIGAPDAAHAAAVLPLSVDPDPLVAHVAVNALVELRAARACLAAVSDSDPALAGGALNALQQMHDPAVVEGLASRLDQVKAPALRARLFQALCRLYSREGEWDGSWWATRPDSSGPYYQPADWPGTRRVGEVVLRGLNVEPPELARAILVACAVNKVALPEVVDRLQQEAAKDPSLRDALLGVLARQPQLTDAHVQAISAIARSDEYAPATRARAIRLLNEHPESPAAVEAAVEALAPVAERERPERELANVLDSFVRDAQQARNVPILARLSEAGAASRREVALAALAGIAASRLTDAPTRAAAEAAIDKALQDPTAVAAALRAVGRARADRYADQVRGRLDDRDSAVADAASFAARRMRLNSSRRGGGGGNNATSQPQEPTLATLSYDRALAGVANVPGDVSRGMELFTRQGCVACHTVTPDQPPKGPYLGGIATRYSRAELCESILRPSAKIAQGFETQWFKVKGDVIEGFVTRESGDEIEVRDVAGKVTLLKRQQVGSRGTRPTSVMPENLAGNLTVEDLASLVAYLESLKGH